MKENRRRRIAALAAAAALMMSVFAGCGSKTGDDEPGSQSGGNKKDPAATDRPEYVYVAEYKDIAGDFEYVNSNSLAMYDGKIYFSSGSYESVDPDGNVLTEEDEDYWTYSVYSPNIFTLDLASGEAKPVDGYVSPKVPEGSQGSASINALSIDAEGNIWVCENIYAYHYDAPEGVTPEDDECWNYYVDDGNEYYLRKLDLTGAEISTVDISAVTQGSDYFYINYFAVDKDGNIYLTNGDTSVYVLDGDGRVSFTLEMTNWIDRVFQLADGTVAALGYEENGYVIKAIDTAAKDWGKSYDMPQNAWNTYPGGGDYLFYSSSDLALYGYNAEKGENEKILNWLDADVDSNYLSFILPMDNGDILSMSSQWNDSIGGQEHSLVTIVKTPSSEVPQKTILTYACVNLNWSVRSQILAFNRANDTYRIEVKDYSEYNTEEDYSAGLTKLTTEIVSGNVPDLLDTSSLPIEKYAAKGLLEDLYTYMDSDPEYGRDKFVPAVLNTLQTSDGKLYQMVNSFSVYSILGDGSRVGFENGWTLDEMMQVIDQMPEGMEVFSLGTTRDQVLGYVISFGMDDYVDWETGECSFDSEEFISLLEFCNTFPKEFDWENYEYSDEDSDPDRIMAGKQLLLPTSMYSFEEFQLYSAMFNNNAAFKGFPCANRKGNALVVGSGIAMTSSCADKQGGWEFIKSLLSAEYQKENVYNFPSNQEAFDAMLKEAMTPTYYTDPETGEQVEESHGGWGWGSLMIELYALTQEEADMIVDVINSVEKVYSYDNDIMNIITEECAAFFNGEKSARDTANLIQSRVRIYVNEQR